MTPTMTFLQPGPNSAQSVAAPVAGAPGQQAPSPDFLLMLAQLAGAVAPQPATAMTTPAMPVGVDDMPAEDLPAADDVMAMLSLSLPVAPIAIQPTATATADPSAMMKLAADVLQGKSSAIAAQGEVPAELIEADPTATDDSTVSFDSMLSPTTMTEAQHAAKANEAAAFSRPVHTPVGSAAWADEIGSRLTVMAEQGKHTASLRLSPEHLGPLEIRIAISDDRASVWFGAAHADTRAAIETALPRLRELLESQGLSLTDAGVFREPPREQPTFASSPSSLADGTSTTGEDASAVVASRIRLGLVDAYA